MVCSKVMAILTCYKSLADHSSTSPSSDYIETIWKQPPETRAKIWGRSIGLIESDCHFDPSLKSGRGDLLVVE